MIYLSLEMFERKDYCVCSRSERRDRELFFIELYDFLSRKNLLELLQCSLNQKISSRLFKALSRKQTQKINFQQFLPFFFIFFKICYSNSLDGEHCSNSKTFFSIKKIPVGLRYYFFLSLPFLFFLCFVRLFHFSSKNKEALSQSLEKKKSQRKKFEGKDLKLGEVLGTKIDNLFLDLHKSYHKRELIFA